MRARYRTAFSIPARLLLRLGVASPAAAQNVPVSLDVTYSGCFIVSGPLSLGLVLSGILLAIPALGNPKPVRIFHSAKIITMDPMQPAATAVAVGGARILAVGSLEDVRAELGEHEYVVDDRFADKVLLPGLIDPHLHAYIAGLLLPMEFITPHDWSLPGKQSRSVRGHDAYLARLRRIEAAMETPDGWLDTWGFHHQFHGKLSRADLDAISSTRPILVWHRSFHEIFVNTPALTALGLTAEQVDPHPYASFERGHFQETGLELLLPRLIPRLLSRDRYQKALAHARRAIHAGGITTIADGGFSTLGFDQELQALRHAGFDSDETPFRSILLIDGRTVGGHMGHDMAREWIESLPERGGHRLRLPGKAVKLFADGGAYSQLMQMKDGYLDGHAGKWLMEPADLEAAARVYWQAGFQIHVHVNGDLGLEKTLDVLERLQAEHPREDHRFTVHHLCCATPDQARRIARLGVMVSANPYYVWALADEYAEVGLGPERASRMVPSGSVVAAGVPLAFHSDFPMAPASPMLLAWAAATRTTARGQVVAPDERISLDEALRAVTINAAYQIRMEDQIGSIEVGKLADFTVLERDPYAVPIEQLADIPIWGTVFEGRPYPLGGAE